MINQCNENFRERLKVFLFPFFPVKVTKTTKLLVLISSLIALRVMFAFIKIPLPAFNQTISISWVPLMIMGWIFGPVLGLFLGMVTDSLTFILFSRGVWFWMFAIQEPIVGLVSGVFGSIFRLRKNNENKNIIFDLFFMQIVLLSFASFSYVSLYYWMDPNMKQLKINFGFTLIYKVGCGVVIGLFYIFMNCFLYLYYKENKKQLDKILIFIYSSSLVTLLMFSLSLGLNPYATYELFKFLNNREPEGYARYGLLIYLIPRVIVQSIKVPIESIILSSLIFAINPGIELMKNNLLNSWRK